MFWLKPTMMNRRAMLCNPLDLFDRFLFTNPRRETMTSNELQNTCGCATGSEQESRPAPRRGYVPVVDLVDTEAEAVLVVDVPGVPQGGVDLSIEKNILTLTAVPADGVIAGKTSAHPEHGTGEYRRSFALSDDIDKDRIGATLKDGVLRVHLPKQTPVTKKISVVAN